MAKKEKKEKKPKGKKGAENGDAAEGGVFKFKLFSIIAMIAAVIFYPTTLVLMVGMMPTLVAFIVDRTRRKSKVIAVGAMNLAGCSPFILKLWMENNSIENAWSIVSDPRSIVVIYTLAVVGYMLEWALTGTIATILYQRGFARREEIDRRQIHLIDRWGQDVAGNIVFTAQDEAAKSEPAKKDVGV